jgi:hypothetical protein
MGELEEARGAAREQLIREQERIGMVRSLYESTRQCQRDIAGGLNAGDEIGELRIKVKVSEARFEDLKKSVDAKSQLSPKDSVGAEVVELPNPLPKRRA